MILLLTMSVTMSMQGRERNQGSYLSSFSLSSCTKEPISSCEMSSLKYSGSSFIYWAKTQQSKFRTHSNFALRSLVSEYWKIKLSIFFLSHQFSIRNSVLWRRWSSCCAYHPNTYHYVKNLNIRIFCDVLRDLMYVDFLFM